MSAYPDNVIVLADRRRNRSEYAYEPIEYEPPMRPQLRLVTGSETPRSRSASRCSFTAR